MSGDAAQVLRATLAYLDGGRRWSRYGGAGICVLGALGTVTAREGENVGTRNRWGSASDHLTAVLLSEYADRVSKFDARLVFPFNDHPDTTWADVERVFEKAIANAEAES